LSLTEPNMEYLRQKIGEYSKAGLKKRVLEHCESLNLKSLSEDVEIFLFDRSGKDGILYFPEIIRERL
jgi:hypothetical protein